MAPSHAPRINVPSQGFTMRVDGSMHPASMKNTWLISPKPEAPIYFRANGVR